MHQVRSFFFLCLSVCCAFLAREGLHYLAGRVPPTVFSEEKEKEKAGEAWKGKKKLGTREKQKGRRDPFKSRLQLYAPDPGSFRHVVVMERHGTNPL